MKHSADDLNKNITTCAPIISLWLHRLLIVLGGHRSLITRMGFGSNYMAKVLGFTSAYEYGISKKKHRQILDQLLTQYHQFESDADTIQAPMQLRTNIARIAELTSLTDLDGQILGLVVLLKSERALEELALLGGQLTLEDVNTLLATMLNCPATDIKKALSPHGTLAKSGLVVVDRHGMSPLSSRLNLLSGTFADNILNNDCDPISLIKDTVRLADAAHLSLADYGHIEATLSTLTLYLAQSLQAGQTGVNIFIHGLPGTGKSQLAKVLSQHLDCELFEVATEDDCQDAIGGDKRLRVYQVAQQFFARRKAMILFDEVEDVFSTGGALFAASAAQSKKGWMNRLLEDNPIPTIWLSNSIDHLDAAFIRRFDMVFELAIPPRSTREKILQNECADLLSASDMTRLASDENLAPALVTRTAKIVRSISAELDTHKSAAVFEQLVHNTLVAQGHRPTFTHRLASSSLYDPEFIQTTADLSRIAAGLKRTQSGKICLYGPSGTGKTAFGHWLAQTLDRPLITKRVSDLLSCYVGESEEKIAKAFRQAEREHAVLQIDEVDSFLQDRRQAKQSWELSLVNEMLTQMESFQGVFIASTNLMNNLDQAVLRRFDVKLKFDYLNTEKAWALFKRQCAHLSLPIDETKHAQALGRLRNLTPGDFATVLRQHRFEAIESADELVAKLADECALKEQTARPIGFVA